MMHIDDFVAINKSNMERMLSDLDAWDRTPEDHRANTPERFLKAIYQLADRSSEEFTFTTFPADGNQEMIVLGPIPFYTLCAHHLVPFHGVAYVGYVPDERIAGLSKFARAVKYLAKGFWVQEELTTAIAEMIEQELNPLGAAVVIKAEHLCMAMRGVQQPGVITTTGAMRGVFADHERTAKAEFMQYIGGN